MLPATLNAAAMHANSIGNSACAEATAQLAAAGSSWSPDNSAPSSQQPDLSNPIVSGSSSDIVTPEDQSSCHLDDMADEVDGWLKDDDSAPAAVSKRRPTDYAKPSSCDLDVLIGHLQQSAQQRNAALRTAQQLPLFRAPRSSLHGLIYLQQQQQQQSPEVAAAAAASPFPAASAGAADTASVAGNSAAAGCDFEDYLMAQHLAQMQLMFAERQRLSKAWQLAEAAAQAAFQQQMLTQQLQLQELQQQLVEVQRVVLTAAGQFGVDA
jgi:hypothetical protein